MPRWCCCPRRRRPRPNRSLRNFPGPWRSAQPPGAILLRLPCPLRCLAPLARVLRGPEARSPLRPSRSLPSRASAPGAAPACSPRQRVPLSGPVPCPACGSPRGAAPGARTGCARPVLSHRAACRGNSLARAPLRAQPAEVARSVQLVYDLTPVSIFVTMDVCNGIPCRGVRGGTTRSACVNRWTCTTPAWRRSDWCRTT
jgi:hypothetical protein